MVDEIVAEFVDPGGLEHGDRPAVGDAAGQLAVGEAQVLDPRGCPSRRPGRTFEFVARDGDRAVAERMQRDRVAMVVRAGDGPAPSCPA